MNTPRPSGRSSAPADQFGPYELYERLGLGGMAMVHRAKKRGPEGFERSVALKRMLQHLAEDQTFVESFVREAKVASLLQHPNIAQIYDFGRIGGVYYIAMELVAGFDVRKLLRFANRSHEPIPMYVVLSILGEMCDALEYAHNFVDEQGTPLHIVHRDISPSNLIVAHTGHLKVIDFGIAKAHSRQLHTESGAVKGKLGYMSPEAAAGAQVYPVSDIFSMGVVAWELVTASPLFSARTDFETMRRIREADVMPPSIRNPACPPELDAIILAALHRDQERRMPSASAFREAIDRIAHKSRVQVSARTVAEWMLKYAQPEDSWARSSASGRSRSPSSSPPRSSSSAPPIPLPGEHAPTTNQRPRTASQPPKLRRSEDDIRLANELWDDPAIAPTGSLEDFDAAAMGVPVSSSPTSRPSIAKAPTVSFSPTQPVPITLPVSQPMPVMAAHPSMTAMGLVDPGPAPKPRSAAPWFILVALAGVTATLLTIVVMRDEGEPSKRAPGVAIAETPDAKAVDDDDRVLSPEPAATHDTNKPTPADNATSDPHAPTDAPTDPTQPAVRDRDPKPRDPKRPTRPPPKRTGRVDKPIEPDPTPDPKPDPTPDPPKPTVEPPKPVDPPKPKVEPPKPLEPAKPARTPVVAASAVTKISGELPAMRVNVGDDAGVMAKLCIDETGKVSSVKLVKAPSYLTADLGRALTTWKYKPYTNRDSKLSPACFVVSLRLVVK
ncbi:MAG: serine/threonine protein kinase [Kofleriaceae bacterium]